MPAAYTATALSLFRSDCSKGNDCQSGTAPGELSYDHQTSHKGPDAVAPPLRPSGLEGERSYHCGNRRVSYRTAEIHTVTAILRAAVLLSVIVAAGYFYYIGDGRVSRTTDFRLPIREMRALTAQDGDQLPTTVAVEVVGRDHIPLGLAIAGKGLGHFSMARTAFLVSGPSGRILVDTGMPEDLAAKKQPGTSPVYDAPAQNRVARMMDEADIIVLTHEHWDHMGGLAHSDRLSSLIRKSVLSPSQIAALPALAGKPGPFWNGSSPKALDNSAPTKIAPGVVVMAAPGHTPGSQIIYVRLADGEEVLFIGDITFSIDGIRDVRHRPRLMQNVIMEPPEDRSAVAAQLRSLNTLYLAEPRLRIIPSHDSEHLNRLIRDGFLVDGF